MTDKSILSPNMVKVVSSRLLSVSKSSSLRIKMSIVVKRVDSLQINNRILSVLGKTKLNRLASWSML